MSAFRLGSTRGAGDVEIAYRVSSPSALLEPAESSTLLLIHGWAQSSAAWGAGLLARLAARHRVIALDLRGHGASGLPDDSGYAAIDFAADVAAVLAAETSADTALFDLPAVGVGGVVPIGWSYGGLVICDHLAHRMAHGGDLADVRGVVLVGAITSIGRGQAGGRVGAAMRAALPDACSPDPRTAIGALGAFGTALVPAGRPDLGAQSQLFFGTSLATAPSARAGLFARTAAYDQLLRELGMPVLVLHGTDDQVVDVSAARHAESLLTDPRPSYWQGAGHAPFVEDAARFADEIEAFVADLGSRE
ncbi:alpha/beta fold hydrolase [Williamsia sp. CHRR-6]|uniref:alpha/beta fold hydrolase n=1 Tax=Williamsia sp. CHRR-6 TaxID=2835871 RepID=UPI001BDAB5B2|nr:alpha/beta hydrolase [Williamsia sp. CHRR-6]MBT0566005.1 alpha/beta hydrolase [Williamsia sp. CHRR-6]